MKILAKSGPLGKTNATASFEPIDKFEKSSWIFSKFW